MIRPVPAALCLGLAAAVSAGAAAQDYVAPKPGVVFRFTVSRGPGPAASA